MNKTIFKSKMLYVAIALALVIIVPLTAGVLVNVIKRDTSAYNSSTTTYKLVGELWDSDSQTINTTNFIQMLKYLSSNGTLGEVANSTANAGTIRGYTYNGKTSSQSVVVTLGDMKWQVVYLTKDSRGKKIATLLLNDTTETSTWSSGWYSDSAGTYPSNMYGTSYMRAVTLNNGGQYATSNSVLANNYSPVETNKYATFTMEKFGLTKYLVQPKYVPYQTTPQGTSYTGFSYVLNNEAIGVGGTSSSSYNYSSKPNYDVWGGDYIWLPSLSELGYDSSHTGLWNLSVNERAISSSSYSWSRSSYYSHSYYAYLVDPSGSSSYSDSVHRSYAVRPALHLNLESAVLSTANQVSVSASDSSQGSVSLLGAYSGDLFKASTSATITAIPQVGFSFDYWLVNGNKITANPYVFTVSEDISAVAYFKLAYNVNFTSTNTALNIASSYNLDNGIYSVIPTTANLYIYSVQVDTNEIEILKSRSGILNYSGASGFIRYTVNENNKQIIFEIFAFTGDINIKLTYVNTSPNLPNTSGGASVNGVGLETSDGGQTLVNGFDSEDENAIVHLSAIPYKGYNFEGWYVGDEIITFTNSSGQKVTADSSKLSIDIPLSAVKGKIITAKFAKNTAQNINSETDNSTDFWE